MTNTQKPQPLGPDETSNIEQIRTFLRTLSPADIEHLFDRKRFHFSKWTCTDSGEDYFASADIVYEDFQSEEGLLQVDEDFAREVHHSWRQLAQLHNDRLDG